MCFRFFKVHCFQSANFSRLVLAVLSVSFYSHAATPLQNTNINSTHRYYSQFHSALAMEAHHQNWAIKQDKQGLIYVANNAGISIYDGATWQTLSDDTVWFVQDFALSGNRIYFGSSGDIGYFESVDRVTTPRDGVGKPPQQRHWQYHSLVKAHNIRGVNQIYATEATENGAYFVGHQAIYRYHQGDVTEIKLARHNQIARVKNVNGVLYALGTFGRIWVVDEQKNTLVLLAGTEGLNEYVRDIAAFGKADLLILTLAGGLFHYQAAPQINNKHDNQYALKPFNTDIDDWLQAQNIWKMCVKVNRLGDKEEWVIALASRNNGVAIINEQGQLTHQFNKSTGMPYQSVTDLQLDQDNGLWIAAEGGVTRIDPWSPLTFFRGDDGVQGANVIVAHQGYLLIGSRLSGLYQRPLTSKLPEDQANFQRILPELQSVWAILPLPNGIIVSARRGTFWLTFDANHQVATRKKLSKNRVFAFHQDDKAIYAISGKGLSRVQRIDGLWQLNETRDPELIRQFQFIAKDKKGHLWLAGINGQVNRVSQLERWPNVKVDIFKEDSGLPPGSINVFNIKDELLFTSDQGIFVFDESMPEPFQKHPKYPPSF